MQEQEKYILYDTPLLVALSELTWHGHDRRDGDFSDFLARGFLQHFSWYVWYSFCSECYWGCAKYVQEQEMHILSDIAALVDFPESSWFRHGGIHGDFSDFLAGGFSIIFLWIFATPPVSLICVAQFPPPLSCITHCVFFWEIDRVCLVD